MIASQLPVVRVLHQCTERLCHHAFHLTHAWLRWFWRLQPATKLVALFAHIVALELLASSSPFGRSILAAVVTPVAFSLCLLTCISILFSQTARRENS